MATVLSEMYTILQEENQLKLWWLAGLIEGEGCFFKVNSYSLRVQIKMNDLDVLQKAQAYTGMGRLTGPYRSKLSTTDHWVWLVSQTEEAVLIMKAVYPLMGERRQAKIRELLLLRGDSI